MDNPGDRTWSVMASIFSPWRIWVIVIAWLSSPVWAQVWEEIEFSSEITLAPRTKGLASDGTRLYLTGGDGGHGVLAGTAENGFVELNDIADHAVSLADAETVSLLGFENGAIWLAVSEPGYPPLLRHVPGNFVWEAAGEGLEREGVPAVIEDISWDASTEMWCAIGPVGGIFSSTDGLQWQAAPDTLPGAGSHASIVADHGTVMALRPGTDGPVGSVDGGVTWSTPLMGTNQYIDGTARLLRSNQAAMYLRRYPADNIFASVTANQGKDWKSARLLPLGLDGPLSGDGEVLFSTSHVTNPSGDCRYSLDAGLSWKFFPKNQGLSQPSAFARVGQSLYAIGWDTPAMNPSSVPKLFRLDVSSYNLIPATTILDRPAARGRYFGDSVIFRVIAIGQNLSYQWYHDETPLAGETGSELSLEELGAADAGFYKVKVSGDNGVVSSLPVELSVRAERIGGQPDITYESTERKGGRLLLLPEGDFLTFALSGSLTEVSRLRVDGTVTANAAFHANLKGELGPRPVHPLIDREGNFMAVGYLGSNTPANQRLFRLSSETLEIDPSFFGPIGFDGLLTGVAELPGRGYLVIGEFQHVGDVLAPGITLVRQDGSVDPSLPLYPEFQATKVAMALDGSVWLAGAGGELARFDRHLEPSEIDPIAENHQIHLLQALPDGRVLLALSHNNISMLEIRFSDGAVDSTFTPSNSFPGTIQAVSLQPDGALLVAGNFTQFGDIAVAKQLRLLADGSLDLDYDYTAGFGGGDPVDILWHPLGYAFITNTTSSSEFAGKHGLGNGPVRLFAQVPDLALTARSPSQLLQAGQSTMLFAQAAGSPPFAWQWYRAGVALPGATGSVLPISNFDLSQAGEYTVQLSNESGMLMSPAIHLDLWEPGMRFSAWPLLTELPLNQRQAESAPAGDRVPNLVKFALGIPPLASAVNHLPSVKLVDDGSGNGTGETFPEICFIRDLGVEAVVALQAADRLDFDELLPTRLISAEALGDGLWRLTIRSMTPLSVAPRQFFRLQVNVE